MNDIGLVQTFAAIALVISRSLGTTLIAIENIPWDQKPVFFLGKSGKTFSTLLGILNLLLFIAIAIYLGINSWQLLLIALFVAIFGGMFIPDALVLRLIVLPIYLVYSRLVDRG